MLESWIFWTVLAAFMQSVRTAGQKQLNQSVSAESATLARYLFALPVILGYGFWLFEAHLSTEELYIRDELSYFIHPSSII